MPDRNKSSQSTAPHNMMLHAIVAMKNHRQAFISKSAPDTSSPKQDDVSIQRNGYTYDDQQDHKWGA